MILPAPLLPLLPPYYCPPPPPHAQELGNYKQALNIYRKALAVTPTAADVKYVVSALQGQNIAPARAPASYIAFLFDLEARRRSVSGQTKIRTETGVA